MREAVADGVDGGGDVGREHVGCRLCIEATVEMVAWEVGERRGEYLLKVPEKKEYSAFFHHSSQMQ